MIRQLRKIFSRELLEDGALVPKAYGYAYTDFETDCKIFYVIPLNWIIRGWRGLIFFLRWKGWERDHENKVWKRAMHLRSYNFGRGYEAGMKQSYHANRYNLIVDDLSDTSEIADRDSWKHFLSWFEKKDGRKV